MKRTDNPFFTPEQIKLITNDLLKGAPEFEIQRFLITCERTGLDPFSRQIYGHLQNKKQRKPNTFGNKPENFEWVKTVTIITSIDGFRAIGERSGQYRGQTQPQWYYVNAEGQSDWHDVFITARDRAGNPMKTPDACRVGVLREGFQSPCYGVANFDSFAKFFNEEGSGWVLDTFWKKMPEHMIAKVAEAQAFRKAFPLLACGLFIEEEAQSEEDELAAPGHEVPPGSTVIHSLPPAAPTPPAPAPAPETPKPQEAPMEPERPKRTRRVTTDEAPPENPAKPSPSPEKPAAPPQTPPPANPAPVTPAVPQEPAKPAASGGWGDYVITQVTMGEFQNKRLGDLSAKQIEFLKVNWIDKYSHKIAQNPAKVRDADQIKVAYAHHFPA